MNKSEVIERYGGTRHTWRKWKNGGGWVHSDAVIRRDDLYIDPSVIIRGGVFWDGVFRGGVFRGGVFWGGVFRDGVFRGGIDY